ncbi:MAG: alpha/beta fold hydrolase, partial [bacterium]
MKNRSLTNRASLIALLAVLGLTPLEGYSANAETLSAIPADTRTTDARFRSIEIQGINIAYREAGNSSNPTILLLHGFPTSGHMFRELIPQLAENYHVIAPDYPGFGASAMPALTEFDYSFANYAEVIDELLQTKQIDTYT